MTSLSQLFSSDTLPTSSSELPATTPVPPPSTCVAEIHKTDENQVEKPETVPVPKESNLYIKEPSDNPMNDYWDDVRLFVYYHIFKTHPFQKLKIDIKQRAYSIQSPALRPRVIVESPALQPKPTPLLQPSEENFLSFPRSQFWRLSDAAESTPDPPDDFHCGDFTEFPKRAASRRESIYLITPEGEKIPEKLPELDKDGFKRPDKIGPETDQAATRSGIEAENMKNSTLVKIQIGNLALESSGFTLPPSGIGFSPPIAGKVPEGEEVKPSPLLLYSPYPQLTPPVASQDVPVLPESFTLEPSYAMKVTDDSLIPQPHPEPDPNRMVGTLTFQQRKEKIRKYLEKRKRRIWKKKICYDCRKKVADKRLRVKGRFVTREQAYAILGITAEDLSKNELLMKIIKSNAGCSIITSAHNMKVRNIQTLVVPLENQQEPEQQRPNEKVSEPVPPPPLKVEILKENEREQVVEVKIEALASGQKRKEAAGNNEGGKRCELPEIAQPVFELQRVEVGEKHKKYHVTGGGARYVRR